jgi:hypothetical protein
MKNLRLQHGGAYTADIGSLCDEARKSENKESMTRLLISSSEAVRSRQICNQV